MISSISGIYVQSICSDSNLCSSWDLSPESQTFIANHLLDISTSLTGISNVTWPNLNSRFLFYLLIWPAIPVATSFLKMTSPLFHSSSPSLTSSLISIIQSVNSISYSFKIYLANCNPHGNHKEKIQKIYTKGSKKEIKMAHYKKKTQKKAVI